MGAGRIVQVPEKKKTKKNKKKKKKKISGPLVNH